MSCPMPIQKMDPRYVIFGGLFQISNKLETVSTHILDGITSKQWFLLATLSSLCLSPPTLGEAAMLAGSSYQNVKQIAIKLEEKGFLSIEKDPLDGRISRLLLTEKLDEYTARHSQAQAAFIDKLFKGFSDDEITALLDMIFRMNDHLEEFRQEEAGKKASVNGKSNNRKEKE